jgi:hypothetical protein
MRATPTRERARPSPFNPSYMPLSLPEALGGSSLLDREPVSPTSPEPPLPDISAASLPPERATSAESGQKRWFTGGMFKSKSTSPRASDSIDVQDSNRSSQSLRSEAMRKSPSTESASSAGPGTPRSGQSNYSSSIEIHRDFSSSSTDSLPVVRHVQVPEEDLPANRILAKLDSILGTAQLDSDAPTPLDHPPRRLLLHTPVLQVVNAYTVKDRHLFLFTDLLLITKPIIEDDPVTGQPVPSTLDSSFSVKSVVELRHLKLQAAEDPPEDSSSKKRHPFLVQFVDRFANDPNRAIAALIQKGGLTNDAQTIANLSAFIVVLFRSARRVLTVRPSTVFRNPDLNRNQVGAYLSVPTNRHILRSYIERFRFSGVRIDDALRMFLMSIRLPHSLEAAQYVLGVVALQWTETNGNTGFDPSLTLSLVLAIMRLSDALHPGPRDQDGLFSFYNPWVCFSLR